MSRRISFLLGAGASKEAELPMTHELAKELMESLNDERYNLHARDEPWLQALNFAYGQIVGHQSRDGGDPNQAVGIERLISALRLLSMKDEHEAAPFVAGWKLGADGFDPPETPRGLGEAVLEATGNDRRTYGVQSPGDGSVIDDALHEILRSREEGRTATSFQQAERRLVDALRNRLSEVRDPEYLAPILELVDKQPNGVDILSLNYDPVIEKLAEGPQITVDRGLKHWKPGEPMRFIQADKTIRLYKVHGSTDWFVKRSGSQAAPREYVEESSGRQPEGTEPWIVVGDREKLSTPGPILELLHAAEDALRTTEHLVIIGYSFSDSHINSLIANWMGSSETRTLSVIDPGWPIFPTGYRDHLVEEYGLRAGPTEVERPSRLFIRRGGTRKMLDKAIADANLGAEAQRVAINPELESDPGVITFRNVGRDDVFNVRLEIGAPSGTDGVDPDSRLELDLAAGAQTYGIADLPFELSVMSVAVDEAFSVRCKEDVETGLVAGITYRRYDSRCDQSLTVDLHKLVESGTGVTGDQS